MTADATPAASVFVLTADRPEQLRRCLASLGRQTHTDFELIVVDNGYSHPLSPRDLPAGARLVQDSRRHLPYLFNLGWRAARAPCVAFLADDVVADEGWLAALLDVLSSDQRVAAVGGPIVSAQQPSGEMHRVRLAMRSRPVLRHPWRVYEWLVYEGDMARVGRFCRSGAYTYGAAIPEARGLPRHSVDLLTTSSMGVRRSVLEELGGFDLRYWFNHADGDLFLRMKAAGYELLFDPRASAVHAVSPGPSRNPYVVARDTAVFLCTHLRPANPRDWLGLTANVAGQHLYWIAAAPIYRDLAQLRALAGSVRGVLDYLRQPRSATAASTSSR